MRKIIPFLIAALLVTGCAASPGLAKNSYQLPDKEQMILVYCRSGNRSKQAAQKLADMGYTNIIEFGGIIDWPGETVSE